MGPGGILRKAAVLQNSFVCGQLRLNLNWLKEKGVFLAPAIGQDRDRAGLYFNWLGSQKVSSGPSSFVTPPLGSDLTPSSSGR